MQALFMPEATQSTIEFVSHLSTLMCAICTSRPKNLSNAWWTLRLRWTWACVVVAITPCTFGATELPPPRSGGVLLQKKYGFLPKRFSTYGLHVHIGMPGADDAIWVGNVLQKLTPMFIALAASSPFHPGVWIRVSVRHAL